MARFFYDIRSMETDIYDNVKPRTMLRLAVDGTSRQAELEGAPFSRLLSEKNAVWMLARLKYEQLAPVRSGERLALDVTERSIEGGVYFRVAEFFADGERPVARCTMASMPVELGTRRILRAAEVESSFDRPPRQIPPLGLRRLRIRGELPESASAVVRWSDCDMNGHLTGPAYADLVCDAEGYWRDGPRLCTELQIDYSAECTPGTVLSLAFLRENGRFLLRGTRQDGVLSFTAGGSFTPFNG